MSAALLEAPSRQFAEHSQLLEPDVPKGYEFVDGELKEREVSYLSNYVASEISFVLKLHTKPRELGWVSSEGVSLQCFADDPEKVRRADVAFHSLDTLSDDEATTQGHCRVVPDFVVEVISPNDMFYKVGKKLKEWLKAGVKLVWLVDPDEKTLYAYYADGTSKLFNMGDTITAAPVLPEFAQPLADFFVRPKKSK